MCAIAGYFGEGLAPERARELLSRMLAALSHRGPDGQGMTLRPGAGLAHARLAIVGLADGAQPMATEDDALGLTFNGEIFNYVELRGDMQARGIRFATTSDTEVLLRLFRERGLAGLDQLNGDFAFAVHDAKERSLTLARDRMGVRPLFYTRHEGVLFFASEIKALLTLPGIPTDIDPVALDQIFTLWCPIAPRTAYAGIFELPPGHVLVAKGSDISVRPWWRLSFPDAGDLHPVEKPWEQVEELTALLDDATRLRLRADVPVGAYLSGGLDSSLVSALAARHVGQSLRTFSLTFSSAEHDERDWQRQMAATLPVSFDSLNCYSAAIAAHLPVAMVHIEQPVLRSAPVPLSLLAQRVAASGMKVVLTGEGADELFAGYDIFREAKIRRFCARQPGSKRRPLLFRKLYPYLPGLRQQSPDYLARFFGLEADSLADPLHSHRPRFRSTAAAKLFFSAELKARLGDYDAAAELADSLPADFARWHPLHRAQYLETTHLLPSYILSSQGDRVMMAHAVEGRFPFLDPRVVDFAARLSPLQTLPGLSEKHILKQAARPFVPAAIIDRAKQPYRAPDAEAFRGAGWLDDVLSARALREAGLFNDKAVAKLKDKAAAGQVSGFRDNAAFIGILTTQLSRAALSAPPAARPIPLSGG